MKIHNSCGVADSCDLASAIDEWESAIGAQHVLFTDVTRDQYSRTALPERTRPAGVLRPASTPEVQQIVQIAARHGVPIYPISRGKNWGYGSACPVTEGQVIVDLSRMDRILEVNYELAYAVIEPGVSQGQMYEHLREHYPALMLDVTGAGPDASIVGNALERGFGHTPYGDRFGHSCGMEVVLADGRVLNTGFGAYENTKSARVYRWGIGPWLDGLFSQSNFGIVTKLGVWLMPRPESIQAFAFTMPEHDMLGDVADRLRKLRLLDVVRSNVHIANDLRVLSSRMSYPWHLTQETPLSDSIRRSLRKRAALGAWNVMGALYGTHETVSAARRVVNKVFRDLARVKYFDQQKLNRLTNVAALLNRFSLGHNLRETLASATNVYNLLQGIPSSDFLRGVAWRSRQPVQAPVDPTDFGCIWLSPVLPMTGQACQEVLALIEPVLARHKFEPLMTLSTVSERALCCVTQISFNKADSGERARAAECYDHLFQLLLQNGFVPYRVGIQSMDNLSAGSGDFWDVCRKLKGALDPHGVIAPQRYEPEC
jgi:4-cresol dehydrogenase (hydroxylating)